MIHVFLERVVELWKKNWRSFYLSLCPFALLACAYIQLETSSAYTSIGEWWHFMSTKYALLNLFTIAILFLFFMIVTNKIWLSGLLFSCIYFMIAIVNHYCIVLHGMPLTVMELKNAVTAVNVLGAYRIRPDLKAGCIFGLWILELAVCLIARRFEKKAAPKRRMKVILIRDGIFVLLCVSILWFGYFSPKPVKPRTTIGWMWSEAYRDYGYMACQIEVISSLFGNCVVMPEGYSDEKVAEIQIKETHQEGAMPDVILILNETFYDLSLVTRLDADSDYLAGIHALDNTITGYAVVPSVGGGTNQSEYELLSSNSLYLMPGITPFNVLDMKGAHTIVSHLNSLGYESVAAHPGSSSSYQRSRAYPGIGFDEIHFENDFTDIKAYGNRPHATDESVYQNLISWYEGGRTKDPVFLYCLTIQNHGGWDNNPAEDVIIHATTDYGTYDKQIDEFLSCIALSDEAFVGLTEYLRGVDRDVIVCMVGDHAPYFVQEIMDDGLSQWESELYLRSTPFVIWANYDIEEEEKGFVSMNYMVPFLLDIAGITKSPYYQYMSDMMENIPVITSYGTYFDAEGNYYVMGDETPYMQQVDDYFLMEYNNLNGRRREELFEAY
ncbi:MAG: LTA synthase family protein [Clostridium sp.]|nr:LTA synthase family protein [Clostridium sp.]